LPHHIINRCYVESDALVLYGWGAPSLAECQK
jgi:hypothetical protein